MTVSAVLDAAGRRRSPATMLDYHAGRSPRNKGRAYPADPPTVEEIVAVMRAASDDRHGYRLRALSVVLWRGGCASRKRSRSASATSTPCAGELLVRNGKGGRRREIGMDAWGWEQLRPWLAARVELPVGPLFCVINGPTRGRPWSSANMRVEFRRPARGAQAAAHLHRQRRPGHDRRREPRGHRASRLLPVAMKARPHRQPHRRDADRARRRRHANDRALHARRLITARSPGGTPAALDRDHDVDLSARTH